MRDTQQEAMPIPVPENPRFRVPAGTSVWIRSQKTRGWMQYYTKVELLLPRHSGGSRDRDWAFFKFQGWTIRVRWDKIELLQELAERIDVCPVDREAATNLSHRGEKAAQQGAK